LCFTSIIGTGSVGAIRSRRKNGRRDNINIPQTGKRERLHSRFVLDGREWMERSVPTPSSEKPGALKLLIANGKAVAEFVPANGAAKDVDLHLATLGFDLTTKVNAGENSGRNLRQDFVVLSLTIRICRPAK